MISSETQEMMVAMREHYNSQEQIYNIDESGVTVFVALKDHKAHYNYLIQ